jgi:hypothetical protein
VHRYPKTKISKGSRAAKQTPFRKVPKIFPLFSIHLRAAHIVLAIWLLALSASTWWITAYQFGTDRVSPESYAASWPAGTSIAPAKHGPTLILFLHPKCPCSRATLAQAELLLADLQKHQVALPATYVVATLPDTGNDDWTDTENLRRASQLPGAKLLIDRGGIEAQRFGATISGAIMLFDKDLKRHYAGGITASRGMEGSNIGCDAVRSLLQGDEVVVSSIPAFGCRLCLPHESVSQVKCTNRVCPISHEP